MISFRSHVNMMQIFDVHTGLTWSRAHVNRALIDVLQLFSVSFKLEANIEKRHKIPLPDF